MNYTAIPLESLNKLKEAEIWVMKALELNPNYENAKDRLKTI